MSEAFGVSLKVFLADIPKGKNRDCAFRKHTALNVYHPLRTCRSENRKRVARKERMPGVKRWAASGSSGGSGWHRG